MKRFIILAAALTVALSAAAQPGSPDRGYPGAPDKKNKPEQPTVEQEAQMRVERMAAELPLTDKQVKKLKKILGQDLYSQWRSRHPMDAPKLPDLL